MPLFFSTSISIQHYSRISALKKMSVFFKLSGRFLIFGVRFLPILMLKFSVEIDVQVNHADLLQVQILHVAKEELWFDGKYSFVLDEVSPSNF